MKRTKIVKTVFENFSNLGSGCGSVGRVIVSNTRDPHFESRYRQIYFISNVTNLFWKDEDKEKRGGEWPFFFKKSAIFRVRFPLFKSRWNVKTHQLNARLNRPQSSILLNSISEKFIIGKRSGYRFQWIIYFMGQGLVSFYYSKELVLLILCACLWERDK